MRLTSRDRSNLARFGCALLAKQNRICVRWAKDRLNQAVSANIAARLVHIQCTSGPLLFLAFEIFPTKILPHYCFLPFDLASNTHRNYLCHVFEKGQIDLYFIMADDSRPITRTYNLQPNQCARFADLYASAVADLENFPTGQYDFDHAVNELEQRVRIVDCFEYVLSDTELQRVVAWSKAQAAKMSSEDKAQAAKIADDLLGIFRSRPNGFVRKQLTQLLSIGRAFRFMADLHMHFEGRYNEFAQFVADAIAAHTPKEDNRQLEVFIPLLRSVFALIDQMSETSVEADEASRAQFEAAVRDIVNRVAGGKGVSIGALKNLLSGFGFPLGGLPGRTTEDYSREYALRAEGQKWRRVVEHRLQNDPKTRQEFGGRTFHELTRLERLSLMHRVREGVRSYAKRTGKPFPRQSAT